MTDIHITPPAADGSKLLQRLKGMEETPSSFSTLLMVSIGVLPLSTATDEFWGELAHTLYDYAFSHGAELYELSPADRLVLVQMSELNQVKLIADLKVRILRLISAHFPSNFGTIDQSRLIRTVDLHFKLANTIKFVDHHENRKKDQIRAGSASMRSLAQEDIDRVVLANKEMGPQSFAEKFICHQQVTLITPGQPPARVFHEYYVGMDALKNELFSNVDLRGAGNIFNQLTLVLDRLLLGCLGNLNPKRVKCSINLNVESVFTPAFEAFMAKGDEELFSNILFEFRQDNILQNFDEFEVASELIRSRKGTIAIDAIFPETFGIVNLGRIGVNIAKVFWRDGAEKILPTYQRDFDFVQEGGTAIVLARVDDARGVELGQSLGIKLFQGFYIDDLLKGKK